MSEPKKEMSDSDEYMIRQGYRPVISESRSRFLKNLRSDESFTKLLDFFEVIIIPIMRKCPHCGNNKLSEKYVSLFKFKIERILFHEIVAICDKMISAEKLD